ncbi:uncharacterized protein [Bemisia tabaci]|uniref:uncharacterized protein n=1 Tax=Bemisia tabaci TaxID=7038 RepID=UPI003B27CBF1
MSWVLSPKIFILLIVIVSSAVGRKKGNAGICNGGQGDPVAACNQFCANRYKAIEYDNGVKVPVCKGSCKLKICLCHLNPDLLIPNAPNRYQRWSFNSKLSVRGKYYEALEYRLNYGSAKSKEAAKNDNYLRSSRY